MSRGSFAFTKWYIDCLDRDGRLVILYWVSLEWRHLRVTWHSVTSCEPGARVKTRSSVVPSDPPVASATGVRWRSTRLGFDVELASGVRGIAPQELAPGVSWRCVAPAARATVRLGDVIVRGTGYAEVIELTTPPWNVGIDQLRWGRWIADDAARSVVWIAWKGETERRWVFFDDRLGHTSAVRDDVVSAGDATLALDAPVVVVDRGLSHVIAKVPGLRAVAPRWLLGGHEERRTRTDRLRNGSIEARGTAVDEIVSFG